MGWLYMDSLDGHRSPKAYLENQFTFETDQGKSEILASAMVKMTTWYAACRQFNKAKGISEVFALVCLVRYNQRARDGMIFGYKDMSESMGPCEVQCPVRILDLLGPTVDEHALAWRARCRKTAQQNSRPAPKPGDTVIFPNPIQFTDGSECRRFVYQPEGRHAIFINPASGGRYKIGQWRKLNWIIVPKIDVGRIVA